MTPRSLALADLAVGTALALIGAATHLAVGIAGAVLAAAGAASLAGRSA